MLKFQLYNQDIKSKLETFRYIYLVIDFHSDSSSQDIKSLNKPIDFVYVVQSSTETFHNALSKDLPITFEGLQVPNLSLIKHQINNIRHEMTREFTTHGR